MPLVHESSTAGIAPQNRMDFWRQGSRIIGGLSHATAPGEPFEGSARLTVLESLKIGRFRVSANEARWTRELSRQAPDPFLRFILQCRGEAEIEQGEAHFLLRPGQWTLLNSVRPHCIRSRDMIEELVVIVPRTLVSPRLFDAVAHEPLANRAGQGISRLLFDFAAAVIDEIGPGGSKADEYLAGAGVELVKALLQERFESRTMSTCREIRRDRIRSYIERNLSDPRLSVQSIADGNGCSRRYVHDLFAGEESVHSQIWNSRLERAARDLARRELLDTSITSIALSHGFSCPAHFSRSFKARFACPPRGFRRAAIGGCAPCVKTRSN